MTRVLHSVRRTAAIGTAALLCLSLLAPAAAQAQSYAWKNVAIGGGGFISGIVFNAKQPGLVYARTDIGGAYRWDPAAARWIPLQDWLAPADWNLTGVDALATDPVDPDRLYLVAGTYTNDWTSQNGAVLRSTDRGATFQVTMLPFKVGGNMPARNMGERIAVDPNDNRVLFMGARSGNGLWKSADHGATWTKVTSFPNAGNYVQDPANPYTADNVGVVWVTFDPRSGTAGSASRTIYVGVADKASPIYVTKDGGATWAPVPGQPTGFLAHHGVLSSTGVLYVPYSNKGGPYDGEQGDVYKLDTATGVWTLISPIPSTNTSDNYFGYGGLAVDAQHPNTIMVSTLNSWWPDAILFRSTDGGATWTRIWEWAGYPARSLRYTLDVTATPWLTFGILPQDPVPSPKLGWMIGDLEIDPFDSNRMMYGTGATLYAATDLGKWDTGGKITLKPMVTGIEETAVLDLVSPPSGAPLLSALGDLGGFRHATLDAVPALMFTAPNLTSCTSIDFAELTPTFIVRSGNIDKVASPNVNRAGFSYDGGTSWFQASTEPGGVTGGGTIAAAADASRVVWAPEGPGAQVSWSTNNGSSWTASTGAPTGANAKVASDRVNPLRFYLFAGGTFYVSANGGVSFTAAGAGLTGLTSAKIEAVPGRSGDVWVAGEGAGLFHSTDGGATFTKLANVTSAPSIGFGKAAPGQTYPAIFISGAPSGGVHAVYRSDDAGASWVRVNDDRNQWGAINPVIAGDPRVYGRVYVGTNGRGIFYGDVSSAPTADFALSVAPTSVTVRRGASGTVTVSITRTGTLTDPVALTVSGLPAGVAASFTPASTTGTSSVLTFAVSSTAVGGTYPLTVTGASGTLRRTAAVSLTVSTVVIDPPLVTITPSSLAVVRGGSASATLTFARPSGYTGAISCSASGLPAGVTVAFNPVSTTGNSSTLTFAASTTAVLGAFPVSVICAAGGLTGSAGVNLTVTDAASFTVSAAPTALTVGRGASVASQLTITRTGGFAGAVTFTAAGLPAGVTASFDPTSATGTSSVVTFTASTTAAAGAASVTITGTSGTLSRTVTVALTVLAAPDFSLRFSPPSLTVNPGGTGSTTLYVTRTNGFTGTLACSFAGLPAGVTVTTNPAPGAAATSTVTLSVAAATPPATTNLLLSCAGGGLARTATLALTIAPVSTPDFSLSASPGTLTVTAGSSGASTITITRTGGFTGAVAFSATGLPPGVTLSFTPASTTGTSTAATFVASTTAAPGTANVTITGTSGTAMSRTVVVALTVNPGGTSTVVTATPVVSASGPWYNELQVKLDNTATLTAATITITVAATPGVNPTGQYNTVGGQFAQSRSSTASAVTYTWQLAVGQTLPAGTGRLFAAQFGGNGSLHPTAGDLYSVTFTSGGVTSTVNGHF